MTSEQYEKKLFQAYGVINVLLDKAGLIESEEGLRALDYFSDDSFDESFLPWPHDKGE